jgi:hypothetical protein
MPEDIPADVRNRLEADIAAFQAAVIDADVVDVGRDPEYVPDSPRLREQMGVESDE